MLKIKILSFFLILVLISCENKVKTEATPEIKNERELKTEQEETLTNEQEEKAKVALNFINGYIKFCNDNPANLATDWVYNSKLTTTLFKDTLKKMIKDAYQDDPELGLDYDPVINGQDFPDDGYELGYFEEDDNYLVVRGITLKEFSVRLKLLKNKEQWLVDGCGNINL